jgi:hypothetical protein
LLFSLFQYPVRRLPFSPASALLHALPDPAIYKMCVYSALAGGVVYYVVQWIVQKRYW